MNLGAYMSIKEGYINMLRDAHESRFSTVMFYTGSSRSFNRQNFTPEFCKSFRDACIEFGIENITIHANYLINLGSPDSRIYYSSLDSVKRELHCAEMLGAKNLIIHGGYYKNDIKTASLDRIIVTLRNLLGELDNCSLLIEYMAGRGTELCSSLEELQYIKDGLDSTDKFGVCLDTCHMFASGLDFSDTKGLLRHIENTITLDSVKAIHVNGSLGYCGSRQDIHANIFHGYNALKPEYIANFLRAFAKRNVGAYLETPDYLYNLNESHFQEWVDILKLITGIEYKK